MATSATHIKALPASLPQVVPPPPVVLVGSSVKMPSKAIIDRIKDRVSREKAKRRLAQVIPPLANEPGVGSKRARAKRDRHFLFKERPKEPTKATIQRGKFLTKRKVTFEETVNKRKVTFEETVTRC